MKEIKDFGVNYNEINLTNDIKLYSFYKPNSPIYFRAFFYAGSQFDNDKPGLAHFCEHIFASGTEKYPTKDIINEKIQEIGGMKNAFTNKKNLWLAIDLADKADLPEMFDVVDQMLNYSLFTQVGIDIERKVILAEQTRKISIPAQHIFDLSSSLLLQGTKIENPVLGFDNSVKMINRNDLLEYRDKYLVNGQVAYFISGDFDEKTVTDSLNIINKMRKPIVLPGVILQIINDKKENIKTLENAEQNYLSLVTRIDQISKKMNIIAADVFTAIFGRGNTSRLHKALRSKRGLVYDVGSSMFINPEYCFFSINTNCKITDTNEVIDIIKSELNLIVQDGITEIELTRAKKIILRNLKFLSESAAYWVEYSAMTELTGYPEPILPDEYINILNTIKIEEVNLFIKSYLTNKELLLAGIGDFSFLKK